MTIIKQKTTRTADCYCNLFQRPMGVKATSNPLVCLEHVINTLDFKRYIPSFFQRDE